MCVHIHIYNYIYIYIYIYIFYPYFKTPFLKSGCSEIPVRMTFCTGPSHDSWLTSRLTLDPPWVNCHLSTIVLIPVQGKTRCLPLSDGGLLLDVIMNIAVVSYSRHLSRWRRRGLSLLSLWSESSIYINASLFTQIICDPASSTEEVRIKVFYESLQINFPNNVLVSQYHG